MAIEDRDFKGVWIPREIWLSEKLSLVEKALFVEIHSLDNERGCYASNRYFAEFFAVGERQIRRYIASLKAAGFVIVTVKNKNDRVIRTAGRYSRVADEKRRDFQRRRRELTEKFTLRSGPRR